MAHRGRGERKLPAGMVSPERLRVCPGPPSTGTHRGLLLKAPGARVGPEGDTSATRENHW